MRIRSRILLIEKLLQMMMQRKSQRMSCHQWAAGHRPFQVKRKLIVIGGRTCLFEIGAQPAYEGEERSDHMFVKLMKKVWRLSRSIICIPLGL
jgi:hypothetical protein